LEEKEEEKKGKKCVVLDRFQLGFSPSPSFFLSMLLRATCKLIDLIVVYPPTHSFLGAVIRQNRDLTFRIQDDN
jgi:hypothetical protein